MTALRILQLMKGLKLIQTQQSLIINRETQKIKKKFYMFKADFGDFIMLLVIKTFIK